MPIEPSEKSKREKDIRPLDEEARPRQAEVVRPADKKISEGPGNLRRRAEWFQKRSGGSNNPQLGALAESKDCSLT